MFKIAKSQPPWNVWLDTTCYMNNNLTNIYCFPTKFPHAIELLGIILTFIHSGSLQAIVNTFVTCRDFFVLVLEEDSEETDATDRRDVTKMIVTSERHFLEQVN